MEQAIRFQSELDYVSSHSRFNQRDVSNASIAQLTILHRQLCIELDQVQQVSATPAPYGCRLRIYSVYVLVYYTYALYLN